MIWPILGYSAFGFLLGYTTGLSEGEVAKYFLGLLVAFLGGSIGYFIQKDGEKRILGAVLFFFSLFCVFGLTFGILTKTNRFLTVGQAIEGGAAGYTYLKGSKAKANLEKINSYLQKISSGETSDIKEDVRAIEKLLLEIREK